MFFSRGLIYRYVPHNDVSVNDGPLYGGGPIRLYYIIFLCGKVSSVGIATDYGLDGPGSNSSADEIFRPSRQALKPLYNGYRVFPGGKVLPGRSADHSPPSSAAVMEE